ncbi:MAG: hypothetical protein BWY91_01118 [bacterium ADurb.BinA028]|nr:MAG: hypothetical protein BWY91_01118 [bacterium ADurb.BinA028]
MSVNAKDRFTAYAMSSATTAEPSEYLMPSLSVKVQVRPSADTWPRSVARSGTRTCLPLRLTKDVSERWVSRVMIAPESW